MVTIAERTDYASLPLRRRQAMEFIAAEIEAGRRFPSNRAIAGHVGWLNDSSVTDVLHALTADGFLTRERIPGGAGAGNGAKWRFSFRGVCR